MERYICIHGHFYQPPRENPWLEEIEVQDSAYPFHDWNERITAECYATNGVSRILDGQNRIIQIVNNYARISFNFGPTLLSWMEKKAPSAYRTILAADRESQKYFGGHGSALAQVYNHMIMPLANKRDKYTQVFWGIRDFEKRFGRKPEGMWLAETAVDLETLEILAELDIKFTILSPYQARRVRAQGSKQWQDVVGGHIDPTMAYLQKLPSGRTINLFFYDGPISQGVAFERLLSSGERFAIVSPVPFRMIGTGRNWCILQPMARPMGITIALARWRWPMRCAILKAIIWRILRSMANIWSGIHPHMKWKSWKIRPGVVFTALNAGGATVAVTLVLILDGTRNGVPLCGTRWTGSAMK